MAVERFEFELGLRGVLQQNINLLETSQSNFTDRERSNEQMSRSASKGRSAAQTQQGATDMLRMRKELIQQRSKVTDLQDELEEKTSLYLNAIKSRDKYQEQLNGARNNINRVELLVADKVTQALENERREMTRMQGENDNLKRRVDALDNENKTLQTNKKQLLEKIASKEEDVAFLTRNEDVKESIKRIDQLRREKEEKDKKLNSLMGEINTLSNLVDDMTAENRQLRRMANVPDNYGIELETIKLYDKERIEDYKKLIKVLQDDNYKLEEERANLKHQLKLQAMMYKSNETDPRLRYKGVTEDQLQSIDDYVIRLLQGNAYEPADFYKLKKDNEQLQKTLDMLQNTGFAEMQRQMQDKMASLGGNINQTGGSGINQDQLTKLLTDNEKLRQMVEQLMTQGVTQGSVHDQTVAGIQSRTHVPGQYRPPQPHDGFDGNINQGTSFKFKTDVAVHDQKGQIGLSYSHVYEHAFLQLQLKEVFEINHRQNEQISNQKKEIETLYKRIRTYLLTQDQLYKDCVRLERNFLKKEKRLQERVYQAERLIQEEKDKFTKVEAALKALSTNNDQAVQNKLIELTKQNSILDLNLLRITRKYHNLEEQEKMLRREYHAKDSDMAEKDRFVQERINHLKEWRVKAMTLLHTLFQKLRLAVPICELETTTKKLDVEKQRTSDQILRNAQLVKQINGLQQQNRMNDEADQKLQIMKDDKENLEEEFDIIKKRLENFDPLFKFENQIYQKIANILKRANVSPLQAFEEFDEDKNGTLDKAELKEAIFEKLRVHDMTNREFEILWSSLDTDQSGSVDYHEFVRKLEQYGVKNLSKEEFILYQLAKAAARMKMSMASLFEMIDKKGRGYISKQDFKDIFDSLGELKLNEHELNQFIDNFWSDKTAGIDYKGFLRIFAKYEVKVQNESNAKTGGKSRVTIKRETIELKKRIFMKIDEVLKQENKTIKNLFQAVDGDGSLQIDQVELFKAFKMMDIDVNNIQAQQIFDSIDFDGDKSLSLPEFQTNFREVITTDLQDLIHQNDQANMEMQQSIGGYEFDMNSTMGLPESKEKEIQLQTRIGVLTARNKRLERRYNIAQQIMNNSEQSRQHLQQQCDGYDRNNQELSEEIIKLKETTLMLQAAKAHTMLRSDASQIEQQNEKLIQDLAETRAAMLTYKNMCQVIADQAKNLKLMQERKKDEHENLLEALREMQSEGATKERVGKLYFIIMLSRWQEASVNKKYEAVISEVKDLRNELMNANAQVNNKEIAYRNQEILFQEKAERVLKLENKVQKSKGTYISSTKAVELNRIIQDVNDDKTALEEQHFRLRTEHSTMDAKLNAAILRADANKQLLETLQHEHKDQQSQSLINMSNELQKDRLKKYQLKRENQTMTERITFMDKLIQKKDEAMSKLEEKAAKFEGDIHIIEEENRNRVKDFQRKFFRQRYDAQDNSGANARGGSAAIGGRQNIASKIGQAADLTNTSTKRIREDDIDKGLAIQRQNTMNSQGGGVDWTAKAMIEEKDAHIQQLNQRLKEIENNLQFKENEVGRLKMWQEGDKYLSEDMVLKDTIEDHRIKTLDVARKEQKEISDAAYQTVKTLQEMIEQKNQQLKRKEANIEDLRNKMKAQAQLDAQIINDLREKISTHGDTTMNRLHQIVQKHENSSSMQNTGAFTTNANNSQFRNQIDQLQQELQSKDEQIERLRSGNKGSSKEKEMYIEKNNQLKKLNAQLQDDLRREQERVDLKAANKKLARLQKERTDQDKVIVTLRKAIDTFNERMLSYESEKVQATEKDQITLRREALVKQEAEGAEKMAQKKMDMIVSTRNAAQNELKELKVISQRREEELKELRTHKDEAIQKQQNVLTQLNQEKREKQKLVLELTRYQEEQKIGGNLGGGKMSYAALEERNRELERDNRILEAQKATVITKNPEFGTFEYIGGPVPLNNGNPTDEAKSVSDVVRRMSAWLEKHNRITVGPIFRSLDRGGFGELREKEFSRACDRMGIDLSRQDLKLLRSVLDHRSTGYLKYKPIVQQLSGMPAKVFLDPAIEKLAEYARQKDLLAEEFHLLLDRNQRGQMKHREFKESLTSLRSSDFTIYDEEIDKLFMDLTKQTRISSSAVADIEQLVAIVYEGVKAVLINMMQSGLKKSRRYLVDLIAAKDTDRDGYLEYEQFEDLLLQDLQVGFFPKVYEGIVISQLLDPGKRQNKIKNEIIKMYLGESESGGMVVDMVPSQEGQRAGLSTAGKGAAAKGSAGQSTKANAVQNKMLQAVARKVLMGFQGSLGDVLNKEDSNGDGLLPVATISSIIAAKQIQALQPSELQFLLSHCDSSNYGFLIISNFHSKLLNLGQETEQEVKLRRFAKSIGNQGLNLKAELSQYDRQKKGELDQVQFKRALKQLAVPLTDAEIKELYETGLELSSNGGSGQIEIATFAAKVTDVQRSKPLPAYMNAASKPSSKVGSRIGAGLRSGAAGAGGETGSQFENWEIEKKYKRNLEALKTEIEERNNEILLAKKEVQNVNSRVLKLEAEKQGLENRLIDKNAKPPRQMQADSEHFGNIDEIQKLKDEIFHLQQVNLALQKSMQVGLKAELGKALSEKDILEEKLKSCAEKLRDKVKENHLLLGHPAADSIGRRENQEEGRQKRIEELENDLTEAVERSTSLQEQVYSHEDKLLDFKFEKETFDLQYARLQKRITDLEQYKLQSGSISANIKNQREEELAIIKEQTAKITGEQFSQKGESVKLRNRKIKSVQELETVIDTLSRVIDKQKVEMEVIRKDNSHMKDKIGDANSAQEANQLRRKVEHLQSALHSAEMKEVNLDEQERTMKKLIFANKQLREDLSREIERYNLLEDKFRNMLVKYNLAQKQNEKNEKLVFTMGTGAQLPRYDNFLDEDGHFTSGKKKRNMTAMDIQGDQSPDDSLNRLNRDVFDGL